MKAANPVVLAVAALALGAACGGSIANGVGGLSDDARAPLEGHLVGPPQNLPSLGLPPRGVHPCAEDPMEARDRLREFFSAAHRLAERRSGRVEERRPLIDVVALEEKIVGARVAELPFLYSIQLDGVEALLDDVVRGSPRGRYEHLDRWFVLRCEVFLYVNSAYGLTVDPATDPYEPPAPDGSTLKYAQLARPLTGLDELEQIVDFLYRLGRIPLEGFNQGGELVGRGSFAEDGLLVVEDTIRWTLFSDAVVPDEPPTPPWVSTWVHVVLYDPGSREIAHTAFITGEPERAGSVFVFRQLEVGLDLILVDRIEPDRPYAAIRHPRDGLAYSDRQRRVTFAGAASHARDMLVPEQMHWSSDQDGFLGHGPSLTVDLADLSSGPHRLTFRVCDNRDRCTDATATFVAP